MTLYASELAARDLAVVWHPCTQMHDHETLPMLPIARAEGAWLYGHDGRRWLDAVSSWWTCLLGHRHPRVVAALKDQLDRIDHVMLAGFTHEPAIQLAEELVRIAPRGGRKAGASRLPPLPHEPSSVGAASAAIDVPPTLTRVFYADNGSSAIEVALKLSFHYWRNLGRGERTRFIALTGGYHGETLGALSVTDVALYRHTYAPLLLEPIFAPSPDAYEAAPGESAAACAQRRLGELRAILECHAHESCAVIVEPLVQCAGGMRMHDASYLTGLRALCDEFDLHLIADEIAVGFGRTGTLFACEQGGIVPDFLCLSKGLTGGTLPLSAVLTTTRVYDAFYAEYSAGKAFLHSHSYTGNPIACRAALATLAVLRDEPVLERNRALAAHLDTRLAPLVDHPHVADVRRTGMIAAIELAKDKRTREPFPAAERRGLRVYRHGLANGMLLRPLGNVVYFMPPYCITPEEIDRMVEVAAEGIDVALR
ncbi:adenosylmethionine-8-amino-7-oxononanoate aminotransferase [Dokdonella fugitiva]|uniref:Adenosylmethionine-8-amino-7-oxononanoate aminotransferase n=1 Tax=Dokdonella fugitiva TaxID=328517 RepID=A0A839F537_9GAMM|nr:adenosylmethionine--8-amino-7-oxononanoate transaminase [Dokdonella fugitiva]MBA8889172.1 adenosylmethionine-8-amino-7-oxononanoate aminotransferase [Dokdonella fugitiva]